MIYVYCSLYIIYIYIYIYIYLFIYIHIGGAFRYDKKRYDKVKILINFLTCFYMFANFRFRFVSKVVNLSRIQHIKVVVVNAKFWWYWKLLGQGEAEVFDKLPPTRPLTGFCWLHNGPQQTSILESRTPVCSDVADGCGPPGFQRFYFSVRNAFWQAVLFWRF